MPLSPLSYIFQYESSFNPTAQNPTSTASGLGQDVNATWAEALGAVAGSDALAQYPTAKSAPAALQTEANAWLFNTYGWQPWSSNTNLMAAVNAAGGQSAFSAPGSLSTDAASYAGLNTQTPAQFFAANGGTPTVTGPGLGSGGGVATGVVAPSNNFQPFTWVWTQYQGAVVQPLNDTMGYVTKTAGEPLGILVMIAIASAGLLVAAHIKGTEYFMGKLLKVGFVVVMIGSAQYYQTYFVPLFLSLPTWLGSGFGLTGDVTGTVGSFDNVSTTFLAMVHFAWLTVPWGTEMILDIPLLIASFIVIYGAELFMFAVWFVSQVLSQILLVIGALFHLAMLSQITEGLYYAFAFVLFLLQLVSFMANVVAVIALKIMMAAFNAIPQSSGAAPMISSIFGVALAIAAISFSLIMLPRILERILSASGAVSLGAAASMWINSHLHGAPAGAAAGGGGGGGVGAAVGSIFRPVAAVGSSLSRG